MFRPLFFIYFVSIIRTQYSFTRCSILYLVYTYNIHIIIETLLILFLFLFLFHFISYHHHPTEYSYYLSQWEWHFLESNFLWLEKAVYYFLFIIVCCEKRSYILHMYIVFIHKILCRFYYDIWNINCEQAI